MKTVLALAVVLVAAVFAMAQMSPEEAQRILEKADAQFEPTDSTETATPVERRAASLNETRASTRHQIESLAAHCVIINGSVWCSQAWDERERHLRRLRSREDWDLYRHDGGDPIFTTVDRGGVPTMIAVNKVGRPGFVDPYTLDGAPNYVRLRDGATALGEESARLHELAEAITQREGVTIRSGEVLQVLDDGLLIRGDGTSLWFAETSPHGYVDGDTFLGAFESGGTYQYVDVQGARRTIERYIQTLIDADTTPRPAQPDDVFKILAIQDIPAITLYVPEMVVEQSPSYRMTYPQRTGATGSKRELQAKGVYQWQWRTVNRPLDMRAQ